MFPEDAEKTITSLFASRMIDREIKFEEVMDNPDDDPEEEVLGRQYQVGGTANASSSSSRPATKRESDCSS